VVSAARPRAFGAPCGLRASSSPPMRSMPAAAPLHEERPGCSADEQQGEVPEVHTYRPAGTTSDRRMHTFGAMTLSLGGWRR
jgi:hypothetical protein